MIDKPEIYEGDYLFDLINGGAELYYEYGFEKVLSVHYADPSNSNIQVEIYEMIDIASAYGIFSISQQTAEWFDQPGNLSAVSEDYISFWQNKYYVTLSWSSRQHEDQPMLYVLANEISQKMNKNGHYPDVVQLFQPDFAGKKAVYLKGNIALSNFYYLDYKDIFNIKDAVAGTQEEYHWIFINYTDQEKAQQTITEAKPAIEDNKRFSDLTMSFQGFTLKDNKGNTILVRQIENFIVILVSLNPDISLSPVIDQITQKIEAISH